MEIPNTRVPRPQLRTTPALNIPQKALPLVASLVPLGKHLKSFREVMTFRLLTPLALLLCLAGTPLARAQSPVQKTARVVFIIGENEYHTWETLPDFAKRELEPRGLSCAFVMASPKEHDNFFTNFAAIKDADLLFLSARRRTPPQAMMALIRAHLKDGKPLIGVRTASHAFGADPPDSEHEGWRTFDREILGCSYQDHYNNVGPNAPATIVSVRTAALPHPILTGIPRGELRVTSHLYKSRDLAATVTTLMTGHVEGRPEVEPVAWVNTDQDRRVFYTSLGSPDDFKQPFFRRLLLNAVLWSLDRPVPNDPALTRPEQGAGDRSANGSPGRVRTNTRGRTTRSPRPNRSPPLKSLTIWKSTRSWPNRWCASLCS